MREAGREEQPAAVPQEARQAGEVRARWAWAEPAVWTERMLTALEIGVKGGVWFSLMDKVYALRTLQAAWARVQANGGAGGADGQTVEGFAVNTQENLDRLYRDLREGTYRPHPVKRVWIPKPGSAEKRPLGIPAVRDRVAQGALRAALEPIYERDFAEHSYGFRPGRGCKDALRRVEGLLREGYTWIVDADLKGYFESIPHDRLMARVREKVADGAVLDLIEKYLKQGAMDGLREWTPESGTPQGAVISPLLSNIYLDGLDRAMAGAGFEMTRYADDFVVQCRSEAEAHAALERVRDWVGQAGLELHPQKTRVVEASQPGGFEFLGYRFEAGRRWPRRKSLQKLKATLRKKTPRNNGQSLSAIIASVNETTRGWYGYFKHCSAPTFPEIDGWTRGRLRNILRKRRKRKGIAKGEDHLRWRNAFFDAQGLYSLKTAHARDCQLART